MFNFNSYSQELAFYDDKGHSVTYGDINKISIELYDTIGSRNLICFLCDNTLGSLIYYAALLHIDNVLQIIPYDTREDWIKKYLCSFQFDYICKPIDRGDPLHEIHRCMDYSIVKTKKQDRNIIHPELALLLPSSGSTGECKFIRQSKKNIQANTKSIISYLELSYKDRPILSLPMSYTYGLSVINTHLTVGATMLVSKKKVIQKEFWDFFRQNEGTSFSGVPYHYEILQRFGFFNLELPTLNCFTQAGGKLSDTIIKNYATYARKNKIRFYVMYGQTEATARMTYLPYQYLWKNEKIGSVGIAVPDTKLYLEDDKGNQIKRPHFSGEVIFEGDNVSMGYAMSYSDLGKGDDNQGVLRTGDIACFDEEGFLYITGRKKRFVKICGKQFNLDRIETYILDRYDGKIDCAVVGDDTKIYIVINKQDFCMEIEKELQKYFRLHKSNLCMCYLPDIPKTFSGKKSYSETIRIIENGYA